MQVTPNTPLTLNLTLEKANLVLGSLAAFNEKVTAIHQEIQAQAQMQLQAIQNIPETPPAE